MGAFLIGFEPTKSVYKLIDVNPHHRDVTNSPERNGPNDDERPCSPRDHRCGASTIELQRPKRDGAGVGADTQSPHVQRRVAAVCPNPGQFDFVSRDPSFVARLVPFFGAQIKSNQFVWRAVEIKKDGVNASVWKKQFYTPNLYITRALNPPLEKW